MDKTKKRKYSRPPTIRQIKALQYMNQGMSKRQALLKAGYSNEIASHPTKAFIKSDGVQKMLQSMAGQLADEGLTIEYMVGKFKQWLEATKTTNSFTEPDKNVPDYKTQLEAYKEWKKIMDQHNAENNPTTGQIKRRLTIDEFITGKDEEIVVDGDSEGL